MSRVSRISTTKRRSKRGHKASEATIASIDPLLPYDSDSENNPNNEQNERPTKKRAASPDSDCKKRLKETVFEENIAEERDIIDEHCSAISVSKNKRMILNVEHQKERRDKLKQYLQRFVIISKTYSQKIDKSTQSARRESHSKDKSSIKCDPNSLKYFQGKLRPYQVDGVIWLSGLYENSINGILGDDMGLGKTIQVIALFAYLYERKVPGPFLIVVPLSTLGNWLSEFKKFAPKIPCTSFEFKMTKAEQARFITKKFELDGRLVKPVIICSYQAPIQSNCHLRDYEWQYIVVDEGQRLKNPNTKLSLELRGFLTKNKLLLTGTPLQNTIGELWALFSFLMPELFENMEDFSTLFDLEDLRDAKKLLETEAETKIISKIHKVLTPFMLRREKKLVLRDIVPKKEMIIYCPLTPLQKYLYRAVLSHDIPALTMLKKNPQTDELAVTPKEKRRCVTKVKTYAPPKIKFSDVDYFTIDFTGEVSPKKDNTSCLYHYNTHVPVKIPNRPYMIRLTMNNTMMMLKKAVNHPYLIWTPVVPKNTSNELYVSKHLVALSGKLLVLDALLPKLKAKKHKILIFSTLTMLLDMVEELLIMRRYNYTRLDGSFKIDERNENIESFKDDEKFVFLLSTRAGGLGLNLVSADTVIFMDRDWNPMVDLQAQDRCHRIGQTKPVMVYSLVTKGTIDEIILNRGHIKKRLEKVVIKEGQFKGRKLNDDEIKSLTDLLNEEETTAKIHPNGFHYTDKELDQILDRSDLIREMEKRNQ